MRQGQETDAHPEDGEGQQPSATPQAPSSAQEGSSHSAVLVHLQVLVFLVQLGTEWNR